MSTGISISSINRIKELAEEKRYAEALEILDTQNLDKSINPQFLRISGEVFRQNKRYYDSRRILIKSHQMSPQGIRIIYELIQLYLELGYFTRARKYYEQYLFYSTSDDMQKDYVEYAMKKASGADVKELAAILIPILERMPEDKWNFEAILLYDKMGRKDKALEEGKYILENYKESVYINPVIQYIDDKLDIDEYFYIYPREEIPEDEELFGDLIALEDKVLEEDYLRMYPPEARIVVEAEDKEGIEPKPAKEKKAKKAKKRKNKDNTIENVKPAEKNLSMDTPALKDKTESNHGHISEKTVIEEGGTGNQTESDGDSILKAEHSEITKEEHIRQEREAALDKLLSKKINTEQIRESAKQVAKVVKEIDTEKTKQQVKTAAESVKENVKRATDVLGEAVGAKAVSNDKMKNAGDNAAASPEEQIVDGIIESILEPPKKVVGQVVMNEELDAIIPDSLEAMSAKEIADIEAKKEEAERLELEALEASIKLEEAKKKSKKKTLDSIEETDDSHGTEQNENLEKVHALNLEEDVQNKEDIQNLQQNRIPVTSEEDFRKLKAQFLEEMQKEEEKPLDSLGFITVVQSDVDESIEESLPDAAQILHQMIDNKEFYTGEDSTKFESKESYGNRDFEVEDYEFEAYRDEEVNASLENDTMGEEKPDTEKLSVELIYAQEDVMNFDEIIPEEKITDSLEEKNVFEEDIVPKELHMPEEASAPETGFTLKEMPVSEENKTLEEASAPETGFILKEMWTSEENETSEEASAPETGFTLKEMPVLEETAILEDITSRKEAAVTDMAAVSEKTVHTLDSDNIAVEKVNVNTRERLRIRILISDSMIRKLSDLKESR